MLEQIPHGTPQRQPSSRHQAPGAPAEPDAHPSVLLGSWLVLLAWAWMPPWLPSRISWWMVGLIPLLLLLRDAWWFAQADPLDPDPAWPRRLRLRRRRPTAGPLRAYSHGGPLAPAVTLCGPWHEVPPDIRRAVLAHEAAHVRRGDMLWLPTLLAALLAALPDGFGSYLLSVAICATLNRRMELRADAAAARTVSPAATAAMLRTIGEHQWWARLAAWPVMSLLLTHPPLAARLRALERDAQRPRAGEAPGQPLA